MNICSSLAIPGVWSYFNKEKEATNLCATLWCAPDEEIEKLTNVRPNVLGEWLVAHHLDLDRTDTDIVVKKLINYIDTINGLTDDTRFEAALNTLDVLLLLHQHVQLSAASEELNRLWQRLADVFAQGSFFLSVCDYIAICAAIPDWPVLQHYCASLTAYAVRLLEKCLLDSNSLPCQVRTSRWIPTFQRIEKLVHDIRSSRMPTQMLLTFAESLTSTFFNYVKELKMILTRVSSIDAVDCVSHDAMLIDLCQLFTIWTSISSDLMEMCATPVEQNTELCTINEDKRTFSETVSPVVETTADDGSNSKPAFGLDNEHGVTPMQGTPTPDTMSWLLDDPGAELATSKLKGVLKNQRGSYTTSSQDESPKTDLPISHSLNWLHHLETAEFAKMFGRLFTNSLWHRITTVQVGSDSEELDLSAKDCTVEDVCHERALNGSVISLLLQVPLFATSLHGPLFNTMGCTIVDDHREEGSAAKWDQYQQFHGGVTVRSTMGSWIGAVGTGAGLPYPSIHVGKSTSEFVSFIVSTVTPVLLSMMEADTQSSSAAYIVPPSLDHFNSPNKETTNTPLVVGSPADLTVSSNLGVAKSTCSDSERPNEESTFRSLVLNTLRTLLQFLSGHQTSSSENVPEKHGLMVQVGHIILSVGDDEGQQNLEPLSLCISDYLLIRSLCHLLATVFVNKFQIPMSSISDSLNLLTSDDLSSQMTELMKQYDYAIRALSEHLADMWIQQGELLIVQFADNRQQMPPIDNLSALDNDTPKTHAVLIYQHLFDLWTLVSKTCPAGLARQIMAHVSAQCLHSVAQLFTTEEFLTSVDHKPGLKSDLWILMKTTEFCLFVSCETSTEVIALGQLSADVSLLHGVGTLLTQTFVCQCMPDTIWDRIHRGGFYQGLDLGRTNFLFAFSNWLRFTNPTLFPELPCTMFQTQREQMELEIEWELFTHGKHFDPIRLLSLLTLSDAKLSLNLLVHASSPSNSISKKDYKMISRLFLALFRISPLVPSLHSFPTTVLTRILSRKEFWTLDASSSDSSLPDRWPVWFRAILELLDDPLTRLWKAFDTLVRRHISLDEALSSETLITELKHQSPIVIYNTHEPRPRSFLYNIFMNGKLPCGCNVPQPISPGPEKLNPSLTDEDTTTGNSSSRSKRKQITQEKIQQEVKLASYESYYIRSGYIREAWRRLAGDIIHCVISMVPTGIQSAFAFIEEMIAKSSLVEGKPSSLKGGSLGIHIFLAGLLLRVFDKTEETVDVDQAEVRRLQRLVLWEHLCSLFEAQEGEEELMECKKRMITHLENLPSPHCEFSEAVDSSASSRRFQLTQHVRMVQQHALTDLYFLHWFFKRNLSVIRELIRQEGDFSETTEPLMFSTGVGQSEEENKPNLSLCLLEDLDWDQLSLVNIGLTPDSIQDLRIGIGESERKPSEQLAAAVQLQA